MLPIKNACPNRMPLHRDTIFLLVDFVLLLVAHPLPREHHKCRHIFSSIAPCIKANLCKCPHYPPQPFCFVLLTVARTTLTASRSFSAFTTLNNGLFLQWL